MSAELFILKTNKMKRKDILIILIPTFIFVILWIVFSIHHAINTPTISNATNAQIAPISPNFDTKTIDALKKRVNVTPIYEIQGGNTSPTPTITKTAPASSSAKTATSGGKLK